MIPDETVEAAGEAIRDLWDSADPVTPEMEAKAALEAAAPHLMATVSTLDELVTLDPGTVLQGPDFHEETYKCTAPGTFHAIASLTEYRPSELVGRGPFKIIHAGKRQ